MGFGVQLSSCAALCPLHFLFPWLFELPAIYSTGHAQPLNKECKVDISMMSPEGVGMEACKAPGSNTVSSS